MKKDFFQLLGLWLLYLMIPFLLGKIIQFGFEVTFILIPILYVILFKFSFIGPMINKAILTQILLLPLFALLCVGILNVFNINDPFIHIYTYYGVPWFFILYCFFIPISEELFFREIGPTILRKGYSKNSIMFITSFIFSISHLLGAFGDGFWTFTLLQVIATFVAGLILFNLRETSKSIITSIIGHSLYNFIFCLYVTKFQNLV